MDKVLTKIQQADEHEITQILDAIMQRYTARYPDQEAMFLTLPKNDPEQRRTVLESIFELLKNNGQI